MKAERVGYNKPMCRSKIDGGRRCRCDGGAHRRAAQRARYAIKVAKSEAASTAGSHAHVEQETTDLSYAARTHAEPVYRDPSRTRALAGQVLTALRNDIPYSQWQGSGALKAYVSAAVTHGAVLRDNTVHAVENSWEEHGVSDAGVERLLELKHEHAAGKAAHDAVCEDLLQREYKLKEDHEDWMTNTPVAAEIRSIQDEWASKIDDRMNALSDINKTLFKVNEKRRELYIAEVKKVLEGERELGGAPTLSARTHLTNADKELFEDVVSGFPADMIAFANARHIPLRPMRSKKRAHYGGRVMQKTEDARAGILNANHAISGDDYWSENQDYVNLHDGQLEDRHVPRRETVEDTPENRKALEDRIAEWKARKAKRLESGKVPTVVPVEYAVEGGSPERRLALYIPKAHVKMTRNTAPVGELTFSGRASLAHEFGHHLEYANPEIGYACKEFLRQRTEGFERVVYLKGGGKGRSKKPDEIVTPDGFVDSYIGKHYDDSTDHTEVFSMGVEALVAGQHGGLLGIEIDTSVLEKEGVTRRYRSDPEHFALIMGLLALSNGAVPES